MSYRIYTEPEDGVKPLTSLIGKARHFLYINSYLLDDPRILKAVKEAVKRKVDVRLMVDGRPYGINGDDGTHAEINNLKKTGARVNEICEKYGTRILYDASHVLGLLAGGAFQTDACILRVLFLYLSYSSMIFEVSIILFK